MLWFRVFRADTVKFAHFGTLKTVFQVHLLHIFIRNQNVSHLQKVKVISFYLLILHKTFENSNQVSDFCICLEIENVFNYRFDLSDKHFKKMSCDSIVAIFHKESKNNKQHFVQKHGLLIVIIGKSFNRILHTFRSRICNQNYDLVCHLKFFNHLLCIFCVQFRILLYF